MASSCHLFLQLPIPCHLSSSPTLNFLRNTRHIPFQTSLGIPIIQKSLSHIFPRVSFALTESDSSKSLEPDSQSLLRRLAVITDPRFLFQFSIFLMKIWGGFATRCLNSSMYVFMQESFDLSQDYFAQLPRDLRLDVS